MTQRLPTDLAEGRRALLSRWLALLPHVPDARWFAASWHDCPHRIRRFRCAVREAAVLMSVTALAVPHPDDPGADTAALDDLAAKLALLRQTGEKIAKYTKLQADLQRAIKARLGDAEVGTIAGRPVVTWKRTLRVAVSQKLLKEHYPEVVSEVSDIREVRTFKVLDQ